MRATRLTCLTFSWGFPFFPFFQVFCLGGDVLGGCRKKKRTKKRERTKKKADEMR
jgi:hypothetical protein